MHLHLKPATEGLVIPRPEQFYRPLAKDGEMVPDSSYWRRRIADGDCIIIEDKINSEEGE